MAQLQWVDLLQTTMNKLMEWDKAGANTKMTLSDGSEGLIGDIQVTWDAMSLLSHQPPV